MPRRKLDEVAAYVGAWKYLCAENGRAPDRATFEQLLEREETEMVAEPEPTFAEQPTTRVKDTEPPSVDDQDPSWRLPSRELAEQLLHQRTPTPSPWERPDASGAEPAA
jgi:hypothetical protein